MKHFVFLVILFVLSLRAFAGFEPMQTKELCQKIPKYYGEDIYSKSCFDLSKKYDLETKIIKECLKIHQLTNSFLLAAGKFKTSRQQIRECRYLSEGEAFAPIRCIEMAGHKRLDPERIYECTSENSKQKEQMKCIQGL